LEGCNVLWCGQYRQDWDNDTHQHKYFQIIGMISGKGMIEINDSLYYAEKGKIYLFPPKCMHRIYRGEALEEPMKIIDIKFNVKDKELLADLMKLDYENKLADFWWFMERLKKILAECTLKKKYFHQIINMQLCETLIHLIREKICAEPEGEVVQNEEPMLPKGTYKGMDANQILKYMELHYSDIISLNDLSKIAKVNKTTLINIFKEFYGITPILYLNKIRIEKAKDLLENTDTSISEISELIGFQSIHYFSRYFKKKENCTPTEYRIRHSQNKYYSF
jgi:AraC-like DNA-binding protein